jgi:hypothetical protein
MKNFLNTGFARYGIALAALVGFAACGSGTPADAAGVSGTAQAGAGLADVSINSGTLTLALKFVEFTKDGKAILSQDQAKTVVEGINHLYSQCNIRFKLEEYTTAEPAQHGLEYDTSSMDAMDKVRAPFDTDKALVVVNTGSWNHGNMGPANAWTAMPGQSPSGAVLEGPVADNANIVAHELGHYLNLDHVSDEANMMNPIIYGTSTAIGTAQCEEMRRTAVTVRAAAVRKN